MQTKQFQISIINTVILNNQTALSFEAIAPASFTDIQATPERLESWFLQRIGHMVQTMSLYGFTGAITIKNTDHAMDLHCIAQAAGYRFHTMPAVLINQPMKTMSRRAGEAYK